MIEITFEYLASLFFQKLYIGYEFDLHGKHYIIKKGRKYKNQISVFTIESVYLNTKTSFPIYEYFNSRYSRNYKRGQFNPFHELVRNLESTITLDLINLNNPLHKKSFVYDFCIN